MCTHELVFVPVGREAMPVHLALRCGCGPGNHAGTRVTAVDIAPHAGHVLPTSMWMVSTDRAAVRERHNSSRSEHDGGSGNPTLGCAASLLHTHRESCSSGYTPRCPLRYSQQQACPAAVLHAHSLRILRSRDQTNWHQSRIHLSTGQRLLRAPDPWSYR